MYISTLEVTVAIETEMGMMTGVRVAAGAEVETAKLELSDGGVKGIVGLTCRGKHL